MVLLVQIDQLIGFFHSFAPPYLTLDWDNSGFQVKPELDKCHRILIGLDPTIEFCHRAQDLEIDLAFTHHPLFFDSHKSIEADEPVGRKAQILIRNKIALFSAHTNFDRARNGLSHLLAQHLQLVAPEPLLPANEAQLKKLVTFVPESSEDEVREQLHQAGAGRLGDYSHCSFRTSGQGTFKPGPKSEPYCGQQGSVEEVQESRLEVLVQPQDLESVISTLRRVHPYEEVAYEAYNSGRHDPEVGLGRVGQWEKSRSLGEAVTFVSNQLSIDFKVIRVSGSNDIPISRVAACPGAGGAVIPSACNSQAQLLVVGELDYHERMNAVERGEVVLEVGHYNSEKMFVEGVINRLNNRFSTEQLNLFEHQPGSLYYDN